MTQDRYVAHLSSGFGIGFPIQVKEGIINPQHFLDTLVTYGTGMPFTADNVHHHGRKEVFGISAGQVEDDTPEHIELRTVVPFNGMVAAIVNPWCRFVDEYIIVFVHKKFNGK